MAWHFFQGKKGLLLFIIVRREVGADYKEEVTIRRRPDIDRDMDM